MACRIALFALLVFSALFCSSDSSSQDPETSGEEDISVEDGIKTIGEYGRWDLKVYITDPIEEEKNYFIKTYSNPYGEIETDSRL